MKRFPFFAFLCYLFILLYAVKLSFAVDTLTPNRPISDGETLVSSSQLFELGFFSLGKSKNRYLGLWYKNSNETVVWVANRDNPITDLYGVLTFGNDGNLVLLNQAKNVIWSSNVSRIIADPVAQLLDSGNLVLRDNSNSTSDESYQWRSFDHPSDTLLPGMKLGWNLKTGQETYLTSWRSIDDPTFGDVTLRLDIDHGLPQLLATSGSVKKYRTGQWNGIYFGGIPEMQNSVYKTSLVHNKDELYFMYMPVNDSVITQLTLNQTGSLQRRVMNDWNSEWKILFSLPWDVCDNYGQCGANAICRTSTMPICECLKGFVPISQGKLDLQNWSRSPKCEKKLKLDCQKEEGFLKLEQVKLPDLLEFQLNESMDLKECETECLRNCSCSAYTNLNVSGGNACLMWFGNLIDLREQPGTLRGEDIYIRVPASELELLHDSNKKKRLKTILEVSISTMSGIFMFSLLFYIIWKRIKRKGMQSQEEELDVPLFNLEAIATATNNFSQANILGEGGFGPVYEGKLLTGQQIAVKKLSKNSGQGVEEFRSEVHLIAKLQHRNLVGLLGSCIQGEERMLVYEYLPNKSLDYFIFDHKGKAFLAWKKRFNIVLGIARGLLYLHQDCKLQIVHRDLKPSNILLDSNLNPKISDFGLARILGDNGKEAKTKRVIGTYGYMSPEYAIDGTFSVKSDVFSLGVILLEIVSGQKNRLFSHPDHHHNLLGHAWLLWNEGKALELMDTSWDNSCVKSQVLRCIQVGLLCVQKLPEDRPAMSSVFLMLSYEGAELAQPKQPGFFMERSSIIDATSGQEEHHTGNELSITVLEPR